MYLLFIYQHHIIDSEFLKKKVFKRLEALIIKRLLSFLNLNKNITA